LVSEQTLIFESCLGEFVLNSIEFFLIHPQLLKLGGESIDDAVFLVERGGEVLGGDSKGGFASFTGDAHMILFRKLYMGTYSMEFKHNLDAILQH
jgi:hypothetical protein